jgi:hypothetical protein
LHVTLSIDRTFQENEMQGIKRGFVPPTFDERWYIFYEEGRLYFHRGWTGFCVYVVRFRESKRGFNAWQLQANRNPKQYGVSDDSYDCQMVFWLIDFFLLGRETAMPQHPEPAS